MSKSFQIGEIVCINGGRDRQLDYGVVCSYFVALHVVIAFYDTLQEARNGYLFSKKGVISIDQLESMDEFNDYMLLYNL